MPTTALHLGPADSGRPLTLEEFTTASFAEGHKYELIDGRLSVAPAANQPENYAQEWLSFRLKLYAMLNPEVIDHVTEGARVFLLDRPETTVPEPDVAAYANYPHFALPGTLRWQDVSPLLVAEVLSAEDPDKDLERNAELYRLVPSIREYWVLDTRADAQRPALRAHRRRGRRWHVLDVAGGGRYTTRLLPGLELTLDVRSGPTTWNRR